jgi:hypothetical protein
MGDLSNLESGQIVCMHLPGASVTKTAILLGAFRAIVSKVVGIQESWEDISKEVQWTEINIERKRVIH